MRFSFMICLNAEACAMKSKRTVFQICDFLHSYAQTLALLKINLGICSVHCCKFRWKFKHFKFNCPDRKISKFYISFLSFLKYWTINSMLGSIQTSNVLMHSTFGRVCWFECALCSIIYLRWFYFVSDIILNLVHRRKLSAWSTSSFWLY